MLIVKYFIKRRWKRSASFCKIHNSRGKICSFRR